MSLLTLVGWLESKLRYRSVCVFVRKTEVRTPAPLLSSCTSRNAILPSDSFLSVNWMEGFCPLRWRWNSSSRWYPWGQTTRTSPTYLRHILGLQSTYLEVFHEDVCQNREQGITHCCSFYLLIEGLTKLELRGLQAKFHEGAEVRDGDAGSFLKSVILLQAVWEDQECLIHWYPSE